MHTRVRVARTAGRAIMSQLSYESWSREDLIARLKLLDATLPSSVSSSGRPLPPPAQRIKTQKNFDFTSYQRRKIALKFCYAGWEYNGLAFQNDKTPLPTVEGTLYNALAACKLIDGAAGPEGCGWERCGRTDRGVSSSGQVVSLWVRSNIRQVPNIEPGPSPNHSTSTLVTSATEILGSDLIPFSESDLPIHDVSDPEDDPPMYSGQKHELRYVSMLNRVLPPTIRILAWSPIDPSFSSRFNTKYRHYKYFFSPEGLNIDAMRDAAARLVGEHDFRNLCKIDPSKQITSFRRKILRADISPASVFADESEPDSRVDARPHVYVFDLAGTAFLYNQVRHIMAVLLLIGAGLEPPIVMSALLNVDPTHPALPFRADEPAPDLVTQKPEYQMADALPLVLWECAYGDEDVVWQTDDQETAEDAKAAASSENSLYRQMHAIHTRSLIHSVLDAHFLRAASVFHPPCQNPCPLDAAELSAFLQNNPSIVMSIPLGGGMTRRTAARSYIPLLLRKRLDHVDVVNERWRRGKDERKAAKKLIVAEDK